MGYSSLHYNVAVPDQWVSGTATVYGEGETGGEAAESPVWKGFRLLGADQNVTSTSTTSLPATGGTTLPLMRSPFTLTERSPVRFMPMR